MAAPWEQDEVIAPAAAPWDADEVVSPAPTAKPPDPGKMRSLAVGVAQGATGRWVDEGAAFLADMFGPEPARLGAAAPEEMRQAAESMPTTGDLLKQGMRAEREAAMEHHPWLYGLGEAGGATGMTLAGGMVARGLAGTGSAVAQTATKAPYLHRVGKAAAIGLPVGLAYGAGGSNAAISDPSQWGQLAKDTAIEGAAGVLGGAVAEGAVIPALSAGARYVAKKFGLGRPTPMAPPPTAAPDVPTEQIARETLPEGSLRPEAPSVPMPDENFGQGMEALTARYAPKVKAAVESAEMEWPTAENWVLRDLDITGAGQQKLQRKGLIEFAPRAILDDPRYANAKTLPQKLELVAQKSAEAGRAYDDALTQLDALANRGERFSPLAAADRIVQEVVRPLAQGPAADAPIAKAMMREVAKLRAAGKSGMSFRNAEALKRSFDRHARYDKISGPTPAQQAYQDLRRIIKEEVEVAADAVSQRSGRPEIAKSWLDAKRMHGAMEELGRLVEARVAARSGNRYFTLTDYLAAITGGAADPTGVIGPMMMAAGNKWLRERSPHIMARTTNWAARNPTLNAVKSAATSSGEAFGRFSAPVIEAAKQGDERLAVTIYILSQQYPEFRAKLDALGKAEGAPGVRLAVGQE